MVYRSGSFTNIYDETDENVHLKEEHKIVSDKIDSSGAGDNVASSSASAQKCKISTDLSMHVSSIYNNEQSSSSGRSKLRQNLRNSFKRTTVLPNKEFSDSDSITKSHRSLSLENLQATKIDVDSNKICDKTISTLRKKNRKREINLIKSKSVESVFVDGKVNENFNSLPKNLTCSLPLERLTGILNFLKIKTPSQLLQQQCINDEIEEDDQEEKDGNLCTNKSLCFYCDKKFSSQKIRAKHTERFHTLSKDRRSSSRNPFAVTSASTSLCLKNCPSSTKNDRISQDSQFFNGCSYCSKQPKLQAVAVENQHDVLFHHLIEHHSDKYFACRTCAVRFPDVQKLSEHNHTNHKDDCCTNSRDGSADNSSVKVDFKFVQPLHIEILNNSGSDKEVELNTTTKTRRQLKQAMESFRTEGSLMTRSLSLTTLSSQNSNSSSSNNSISNSNSSSNIYPKDGQILTRLGVTQNRLPKGRKGIRSRRQSTIEVSGPSPVKIRSKVGRVCTSNDPLDPVVVLSRPLTTNRVEPLSCTFDDDFYESVSANVKQNLRCHLDGKLDGGPTSPCPMSPVASVPAIRSTVVKSPLIVDNEIHAATSLSTVTAFPTLLTADQYGCDYSMSSKIKRPITKHSWKWKWDSVKKYKYVNEGGKIVKKIKHPILGLRDLSKLDMWTQLTMRRKHEMMSKQSSENAGQFDLMNIGEVMREEKRKQIDQLNMILDKRLLPQIILEQNDQSLIKEEPINAVDLSLQTTNEEDNKNSIEDNNDFPRCLNLIRSFTLNQNKQTQIILSGEWARPRCYICFGCGARFDKLKTLEEHKMFRHPYVYSTHYEIVGRELIEGNLFKHFFIPTKALNRHRENRLTMITYKTEGIPSSHATPSDNSASEESLDSIRSVPVSFSTSSDTDSKTTLTAPADANETSSFETETNSTTDNQFTGNCTKCQRECHGMLELYKHMLDCSGDYAWILAKKRKYRYFGSKKRRPFNKSLSAFRKTKIKESTSPKSLSSSKEASKIAKVSSVTSLPRTKPSDAESIQKMLENLPAKRTSKQIIPDITKPRVRKFSTVSTKYKIKANCRKSRNLKTTKVIASTTLNAISKNIRRTHKLKVMQRHRKVFEQTAAVNEISEQEHISEDSSKTNKKTVEIRNSEMKKPNIIKTEKNMVKSIGTKTKYFVKKLTQKFKSRKHTNKPMVIKNLDSNPVNNDNKKEKAVSNKVIARRKGDRFLRKLNLRKTRNIKNKQQNKPKNVHNDGIKGKEKPVVNKKITKRCVVKLFDKITPNSLAEQTKEIDGDIQKCETTNSNSNEEKEKSPQHQLIDKLIVSDMETILTTHDNKEEDHESIKNSNNIYDQKSSHKCQTSPGSKRRSKKLNDCIAMLTGKLQEKLGKPFLEVEETNNLNIVLKPISNQNKTNENDHTTIKSFNCDKNDLDIAVDVAKKPPKRKAMTRKIIKVNQNDSTESLVTPQTNVSVSNSLIENHGVKSTESYAILNINKVEVEPTSYQNINDSGLKSVSTSAPNCHKHNISSEDTVTRLHNSTIVSPAEKENKGNKPRRNITKKSNSKMLSNIDKSIEEVVRTSAILADEEELKAKANAVAALNKSVGTTNVILTAPMPPSSFSCLNLFNHDVPLDVPLDLSKKPSSNLSCKSEFKTFPDKTTKHPLPSPTSEVLDLSKTSCRVDAIINPTSKEAISNIPSTQKYPETLRIPDIKNKTRVCFNSTETPSSFEFLVDAKKCSNFKSKEVTTLHVPKPMTNFKSGDIAMQKPSVDLAGQNTTLDSKTKRKTKKDSTNYLNLNIKSFNIPSILSTIQIKEKLNVLDIPVLNIPRPSVNIENKFKKNETCTTLQNSINTALTSIVNEPIIENNRQILNIGEKTPSMDIANEVPMVDKNNDVLQNGSLIQCKQSEHISSIIGNKNETHKNNIKELTCIDPTNICLRTSDTTYSNVAPLVSDTEINTVIKNSDSQTSLEKENKVKPTKTDQNIIGNNENPACKVTPLDLENNVLDQNVCTNMTISPQNSNGIRSEMESMENTEDTSGNSCYPEDKLKEIPEEKSIENITEPIEENSLKKDDKKPADNISKSGKNIKLKQQKGPKSEHEKHNVRPKRKAAIKFNKTHADAEKSVVGETNKIGIKNSKKDLKNINVDVINNDVLKKNENIEATNESLNTMPSIITLPVDDTEKIKKSLNTQPNPSNNFKKKTIKKKPKTTNVTNTRDTRTSIKKKLIESFETEVGQCDKTKNETDNSINISKELVDSNELPKKIVSSTSSNNKRLKEKSCKTIGQKTTELIKSDTDPIGNLNVVRRSARNKSVGENLSILQNKLSNTSTIQENLEGDLLARKEADDILASFLNDDENAILHESQKMENNDGPTRIEETIDIPCSDLSRIDEWDSVDVPSNDNSLPTDKKKSLDCPKTQSSNSHGQDGTQSNSVYENNVTELKDTISMSTSIPKNSEVSDINVPILRDENSVASITTVSTTKKLRRRRRNELAAIVADQLLESFKEVDQSRIENLKLLENLAFEKNEELLLTGMRLTPSTRRKSVKLINDPIQEVKDVDICKKINKNDVNESTVELMPIKIVEQCIETPASINPLSNEIDDSAKNMEISEEKDKRKRSKKVVGNKKSETIKNELPPTKESQIISKPKNLISSNKDPECFGNLQDEPTSKKTHKSSNQFDAYRTLNNSFQTFRSMDCDLKKNNKPRANNMSKLLELPEFSIPLLVSEGINVAESKRNEIVEKKSSNLHKKLRKKISKKKDKNCSESENINEVRTVLESFTFGKGDQSKIVETSSFRQNLNSNITNTKGGLFSKQVMNKISVSNLNLENKLISSGEKKKVSILRPSILAATLDGTSATTRTNTAETADSSKFSSRDPRLNKNIHVEDRRQSPPVLTKTDHQRKMGSIRQRRKSESSNLLSPFIEDELNTAIVYPRERLRHSTRRAAAAMKQQIKPDDELKTNKNGAPKELSDEEDNYLALIAKDVNEKIMSADDKDFNAANDGFELANKFLGNSEPFSRPSTSLSMCSAPNLNDDHSNMTFNGNTSNELLDMDLDDDISIYTSFSQDVSRVGGRGKNVGRRRRRKSILMTRRSRKASTSTLNPNETYDCELCVKSFSKAAALAKHQMSLSHVSKVSEQEYLISNKMKLKDDEIQLNDLISSNQVQVLEEKINKPINTADYQQNRFKEAETGPNQLIPNEELKNKESLENKPESKSYPISTIPGSLTPKNISKQEKTKLVTLPSTSILNQSGIEPISSPEQNDLYPANSSSRLTLNPDERLFFECCNILKGSETPLVERTYTALSSAKYVYDIPKSPSPKSKELFNQPSLIPRRGNYTHSNNNTAMMPTKGLSVKQSVYPGIDINQFSDISSDSSPTKAEISEKLPYTAIPSQFTDTNINKNQRYDTFNGNGYVSSQVVIPSTTTEMTARVFVNQPSQSVHLDQIQSGNDGIIKHKQSFMSPIYSTSSQSSTLATVTTSRLKTKAAMKGYDNLKISIPTVGLNMEQALQRSPHLSCKLTALAEIALGNEAPQTKTNIPSQVDEEDSDGNEQLSKGYQEISVKNDKKSNSEMVKIGKIKRVDVSELEQKEKDIYDFEESQDEVRSITTTKSSEKIIIPDRPFKNIGLDEQQTIKFQKPETFVQNEESVMSIISYSDRDDFNYGSLSDGGDDYVDPDKNIDYLNNDLQDGTDISSNSSAVTAKTFENKSLIMGRIFNKKATSKSKIEEKLPIVKITEPNKKHMPKQDLDRLFDKLRGFDEEKKVSSTIDVKSLKKTLSEKKPKVPRRTPVAKKLNKTEIAKSKYTQNVNTSSKSVDNRSKSSAKISKPKEQSKIISKRKSEPSSPHGDILQKLNDDGKRKSQRRCTANRSKKLVEMWSSDEYEEFLSTNDIIALIEEKEKVDQQKKKKPAAETSSSLKIPTAELLRQPVTPKTPRRKDSRKDNKIESSNSVKKKMTDQTQLKEESQLKKSEDNSISKINNNLQKKTLDKKKSEKHLKQNIPKKSKAKDDIITQKKYQSTSKTGNQIQIIESESEFEVDSMKKSSIKDLKRRKTISFKGEPKMKKSSKNLSKKTTVSKSTKLANTTKPMTRRKRIASEMLYYWSSSSDEEFGRIESPRDDEDDLVDESGEHYQQHGWIVGDSHKKLVTLLAIAKGTKKVDDCGVKQTKKKI